MLSSLLFFEWCSLQDLHLRTVSFEASRANVLRYGS